MLKNQKLMQSKDYGVLFGSFLEQGKIATRDYILLQDYCK